MSHEAVPSARVAEATPTRSALRICPLCEATCGLTLTIDDTRRRVISARGDRQDVFSAGFICPKGASFAELDNDPDRLVRPLIRRHGEFIEATWAEAFAEIVKGLRPIIEAGGGTSVAVYAGNPNGHTVAGGLYMPFVLAALGTRHLFSASTLDQMPKQVALGYMFGNPFSFTVPDVDRTDHLVVFGANPLVSNGSLATAANFPGKLKALRKRGGRLTVVDPHRTRTAEIADCHLAPRPGTDAALLFAVVQVLFEENLIAPDLGGLAPHVRGVDEVQALAAGFTPEAVAAHCGIGADDIRILARDIASAPTAAVYGRIGTTTVEFGTVASWLIDVVNILTGNLDRPGGVMFPLSPIASAPRPARPGRGFATGRWHSRVSGYAEVGSELPSVCMAEEIDTPGDGQIKALITIAGNPVLSVPNGRRLSHALSGLDFMISIDPYLNETTRHANVVLPPPPPSQSPHFDTFFPMVSVRNNARYSHAALPMADDRPSEAEIMSRLALIISGAAPDADPGLLDERAIASALVKKTKDPESLVAGRSVDELKAMLPAGPGHERRIDMMLRLGPYGDAFGAKPGGLNLEKLKAAPHGIDLGPLQPRIPQVLQTPSGHVELAPEVLVADVERLRAAVDRPPDGLLLIGRRQLRSNNSWMHNLPALMGGTNQCTLQVHPEDAERLGLGDFATVKGAGGELRVQVELTTAIRPGVVCLPHGWGHDLKDTRLGVASRHPGVNVNQLNDGTFLEPLSGTAVLNGFAVEVVAAD